MITFSLRVDQPLNQLDGGSVSLFLSDSGVILYSTSVSQLFCHSVSESVNLEVLIQLDIFILLTKNLKDSFQKC